MHARVFVPPIFIAQDPQIPSRQERRKVKVGSISFFILISASNTMGPQLFNRIRFFNFKQSQKYIFNNKIILNISIRHYMQQTLNLDFNPLKK